MFFRENIENYWVKLQLKSLNSGRKSSMEMSLNSSGLQRKKYIQLIFSFPRQLCSKCVKTIRLFNSTKTKRKKTIIISLNRKTSFLIWFSGWSHLRRSISTRREVNKCVGVKITIFIHFLKCRRYLSQWWVKNIEIIIWQKKRSQVRETMSALE